jgi:hypothetical protein
MSNHMKGINDRILYDETKNRFMFKENGDVTPIVCTQNKLKSVILELNPEYVFPKYKVPLNVKGDHHSHHAHLKNITRRQSWQLLKREVRDNLLV